MTLYTRVDKSSPDLYHYHWPPVNQYSQLTKEIHEFIQADTPIQRQLLNAKVSDTTYRDRFIHEALATLYAYIFGYEDSPVYLKTNDILETQLNRTKIYLEAELFASLIDTVPSFPTDLDQEQAGDYLYKLSKYNQAVEHELFDYIEKTASAEALSLFLLTEVVRNEVVDDEVALLSVGLQGMMKNVIVANLWDECGHGCLTNFHTYWLRRLLQRQEAWQHLREYRKSQPWFTKIIANSLNMLLTRSPYKYEAYGTFLINEGFVAPHFRPILKGLQRTQLDHEDIGIYFKAHVIVDPNHTMELVKAVKQQQPKLTQNKINKIIMGSHLAIAAASKQYQYMLEYLQGLS